MKIPTVTAGTLWLAAACQLLFNTAVQAQACSQSAYGMALACAAEVRDDLGEALVICINISDEEEAAECWEDAFGDEAQAVDFCAEQAAARAELCGKIGEAPYDQSEFWIAENFVDPLEIGESVAANPYFPLTQGSSNVYFDGSETVTVVVTSETKLIEGVTCVTVNDLVTEDGLNVEDTDDWYAQDLAGNVWYCGEIALNFEFFDGDEPEAAELVDIEGSWKAFRDGAQPGILMFAEPIPGTTYRQEISWGDAEDVAELLLIDADGLLQEDECEQSHAAVAEFIDASCDSNCLVTLEYSPVEPDVFAHKYYAPGVGLLAEAEDGGCLAPAGIIETGEEDGAEDGEDD